MNRLFPAIFGLLLCCQVSSASCHISGSVKCEGKGIGGVAVSDGFSVVYTRADGSYSLSSDLVFGYVFISTPSGYAAPCNGPFPEFYRTLSGDRKRWRGVDFELVPDPGQEDHTLVCMGDFHLAGIHDDLNQFAGFVRDVNCYVASERDRKLYGITVGDMSWDEYWVSKGFTIRDAVEKLRDIRGLTIYPVIGNHDYELEKAGSLETSEAFRKCAGPVYYSFNIGKIHYVVLDAIECTNSGKGTRSYNRIVTASQLEWLKRDIARLDTDCQIVAVSHIPVSGIRNADALLSAFARFLRPVHFVTAHYHSIQNTNRLNVADGPEYYDHMAGCPAGSLWLTGLHSPGIHICKDGAPGGYFLLSASGPELSWVYKSTGHPLSYQFRAYDGNRICLDPQKYVPDACRENLAAFRKIAAGWMEPDSGNWIYVNIWGRDSRWKVEASENGVPLKMEVCKLYDPLHIISYPAKVLNSVVPAGKIPQNTIPGRHFVKFKASSPDSDIEIRVTDRFGNVYSETMTRPREFSIENYISR